MNADARCGAPRNRRRRLAGIVLTLTAGVALAAPAPTSAAPAPEPAPSYRSGPSAATLRMATPSEQRVRAFAYAGTTDPLQSLTATWSTSRRNAPWVLTIHGGTWIQGTQAWVSDAVRFFYPRGWQVFNMSYRLGTDRLTGRPVTWAQQWADVVAARNWIRAHAGAFGIDPGRGTAYGTSAGGHMAALIGLTGGFGAVVTVAGVLQPQRIAIDAAGLNPAEPRTQEMSWIAARERAMMGCEFVADASPCGRAWRAFMPESLIRNTPLRGMYIIHGSLDPAVPVSTARSFAYHLSQGHVANRVYIAPGFGHTDGDLYQNAALKDDVIRHVLAWTSRDVP